MRIVMESYSVFARIVFAAYQILKWAVLAALPMQLLSRAQ